MCDITKNNRKMVLDRRGSNSNSIRFSNPNFIVSHIASWNESCCYWSKIFIMRESQFLPTLVLRWEVLLSGTLPFSCNLYIAFIASRIWQEVSWKQLEFSLVCPLHRYWCRIQISGFFKFLGLVPLMWQFWISQSTLHLWSGLKYLQKTVWAFSRDTGSVTQIHQGKSLQVSHHCQNKAAAQGRERRVSFRALNLLSYLWFLCKLSALLSKVSSWSDS